MVFPNKLPTQDAGTTGAEQQIQLALPTQHPRTASSSPSLPLVPLLLSVYNLMILEEQLQTIICRYIISSSPSSRKASPDYTSCDCDTGWLLLKEPTPEAPASLLAPTTVLDYYLSLLVCQYCPLS